MPSNVTDVPGSHGPKQSGSVIVPTDVPIHTSTISLGSHLIFLAGGGLVLSSQIDDVLELLDDEFDEETVDEDEFPPAPPPIVLLPPHEDDEDDDEDDEDVVEDNVGNIEFIDVTAVVDDDFIDRFDKFVVVADDGVVVLAVVAGC